MGDTHRDPTDHWRTTNSHTGETFIDTYCWPGLVSIALGITSLVGCLAAAAYQDAEWVPMTGIVSVLATAGGISWLVVEHHRVLHLESNWRAVHPGERPDMPIGLGPAPEQGWVAPQPCPKRR